MKALVSVRNLKSGKLSVQLRRVKVGGRQKGRTRRLPRVHKDPIHQKNLHDPPQNAPKEPPRPSAK